MALKLEERSYHRVPVGSVVTIENERVAGTTYFLSGRVDKGGSLKRRWSHTELNGRKVTFSISETGATIARISVAFTGHSTSTVKVSASIKKPEGGQHGQTWSATLSGKLGDTARAKIRVRAS